MPTEVKVRQTLLRPARHASHTPQGTIGLTKMGLPKRSFPYGSARWPTNFMPEHLTRLGTDMLTGSDVQIAATDSGVRDVHRHPARTGLGNRNSPYGDDLLAFPDKRILLMHDPSPIFSSPLSHFLRKWSSTTKLNRSNSGGCDHFRREGRLRCRLCFGR